MQGNIKHLIHNNNFFSSEEVTILITMRQNDTNFELSVVHRQLRSALLQILQNQAVIISRFGNSY